MKNIVSLLLGLLLTACASEPPAFVDSGEKQVTPHTKQVYRAQDPPEGLLAPVDTWRRQLRQQVAKPWQLTRIEGQIQAPRGWSALKGSRGLQLTFSNGEDEQQFWVMPQGFQGRAIDPRAAARKRASNDRFILYAPRQDAPGWKATAEVAAALGLK